MCVSSTVLRVHLNFMRSTSGCNVVQLFSHELQVVCTCNSRHNCWSAIVICRVFYPLLKFDDFCHIAVSRKYRIKHDQTQCSREQSAAGYENRMTNCKSMEVIKAAAAALNQQTDHHPVVLIEPTAMGSPCPFDSAGDVSTYVQVISCMYIKKLVQQEY